MKYNIDYTEAFQLLLADFLSAESPACEEQEAHALVTHWLQSPERPAIYGGKNLSERWQRLLVAFRRAQEGKIKQSKNSEISKIKDAKLKIRNDIAFPPPRNYDFTFVDLFAGIGGFRLALQKEALDSNYYRKYGVQGANGKCVFSSEIEKRAKDTYFQNYGEYPFGNIRQFTAPSVPDEKIDEHIPDHDVLAAGFPCQPFSRAGVSARNALDQEHGFACKTKGTLFYDIARIANAKRPKVLFLENVKNIVTHKNGQTFKIIKHTIENELGYSFSHAVLNSSSIVPQRRERCYMVCFRDASVRFDFDPLREFFSGEPLSLRGILQNDPTKTDPHIISDKLWEGHQRRTKRNLERGTGFTAFTADLDEPSNTLVARYGKDGKECLIPREDGNPRMLTPRECARLQGFPEAFVLPRYKTRAYRQFGNAVAVPVVAKIAEYISKYIKKPVFA